MTLSALAACSFLHDLDALEGSLDASPAVGSSGALDAGSTGSTSSTGAPGPTDAASDAATEAGSPCRGSAGPTPVAVGAYCIDSTEVSNRQYSEFLAAKAGGTDGQPDVCAWNVSFAPFGAASTDDYPVFGPDWCDALAYCSWAGKRLCGALGGGPPVEALRDNPLADEWFAACTAGGERAYPYGNTRDPNACKGYDNDGGRGTVEVGSLATCQGGYPGIFDLTGNVWEWEDGCGDGGADAGCTARGGSFVSTNQTGCATRARARRDHLGFNDIGIRCCSDLAP